MNIYNSSKFDRNTAGNEGGAIYNIGEMNLYGAKVMKNFIMNNERLCKVSAIFVQASADPNLFGLCRAQPILCNA